MLTGLTKPDAGRIEMRDRVGALIALGAASTLCSPVTKTSFTLDLLDTAV
jgi:ABC-type polysaccharide/polyol phosphate transport system ATPase subunit